MTADRRPTCRMLDRRHNRCTAEPIDPDAEIVICQRHAAQVMQLIGDQMEAAGLTLGLARGA